MAACCIEQQLYHREGFSFAVSVVLYHKLGNMKHVVQENRLGLCKSEIWDISVLQNSKLTPTECLAHLLF